MTTKEDKVRSSKRPYGEKLFILQGIGSNHKETKRFIKDLHHVNKMTIRNAKVGLSIDNLARCVQGGQSTQSRFSTRAMISSNWP